MASGNTSVYDVLVALHVVSALVGFGAVALNGIYGMSARHIDRPDVSEETRRYFSRPSRAEHLLIVVPVIGAAALGFRPGGANYGEVWVVAGLLIWVAATVILLAWVRPAERVVRQRLAPPTDPGGPEGPSLVGAATRLAWGAAISDVLFVVALGFMVTQPR